MIRGGILAALTIIFANFANAETLRLAVTTTFRNAGLADVLLPTARADLGIDIDLIVVGTGQAIALGRAGDVDAILVHARKAEEAMIADGHATHRREIMYNDFVLIGPKADPAQVLSTATATDAMRAIASSTTTFVSRGDDSGTHLRELVLWQSAGVTENMRKVDWYKAVGAGMGTALNIASGLNAYILSDRASWLTFHNKGDLVLVFSGDPVLFNQYSFLPVSPTMHPYVHYDLAMQFEAWLTSEKAQLLISGHRLNGTLLFTYNAVE